MTHIPCYLQMKGVHIQSRYENQLPYCEYCKSQGHERANCEELACPTVCIVKAKVMTEQIVKN